MLKSYTRMHFPYGQKVYFDSQNVGVHPQLTIQIRIEIYGQTATVGAANIKVKKQTKYFLC